MNLIIRIYSSDLAAIDLLWVISIRKYHSKIPSVTILQIATLRIELEAKLIKLTDF
jgi:hypothetical protein